MKIVCISDTHSQHQDILLNDSFSDVSLPLDADMIIHAGDLTGMGYEGEVREFLEWFSNLPYKYKIFVAGNHDFLFEFEKKKAQNLLKQFPNIIYLENESVEIEGIKIFGSPIQPWFHGWAFNVQRGEAIAKFWKMIPKGVDILITHGPPAGILDFTLRGENVGCRDLTIRTFEVKPKIHIFGHVHEAAGYQVVNDIHFVNASCVNSSYQLNFQPIVLELDKNKNVKRIMETTEKILPEIKPEISFEDYLKLDVRLCQILSVEKVEKKDKLYKMEIDTGVDKRIVVSAIAQIFKPEELLGKTLPFILNLAPRPIAGIESRAMIILADATLTGETLQIASNSQNLGVGAIVI